MNESKNHAAMLYKTVPAVASLNHVNGFDPLKLLRRTRSAQTGEPVLKLDLRYKRLWFRLACPKGRLRLNALRITEQIAIFEAKVYRNLEDSEPISSYIAECSRDTTPGGLYVEAAQSEALNTALSNAGFGIQFADVAGGEDAFNSGAKYIVTPAFNPDVVDRCIELGIPVFPGCSNVTDIDQAYSRGLRVVKFFPSELLGGIEMMKALSGPYPFMKFIPTGGINFSNLGTYLSFNKVLCCAGTFIATEENLCAGRFAEITRTAHAAVDEVLSLKLDHVALNLDSAAAEDVLKGFSRLAGKNYDPAESSVFGVEAVRNSNRNSAGHIVYSSPNLERCVYYLRNRGFCVDEPSSVKDNNRLSEIFLIAKFGNFEIKIIKR